MPQNFLKKMIARRVPRIEMETTETNRMVRADQHRAWMCESCDAILFDWRIQQINNPNVLVTASSHIMARGQRVIRSSRNFRQALSAHDWAYARPHRKTLPQSPRFTAVCPRRHRDGRPWWIATPPDIANDSKNQRQCVVWFDMHLVGDSKSDPRPQSVQAAEVMVMAQTPGFGPLTLRLRTYPHSI